VSVRHDNGREATTGDPKGASRSESSRPPQEGQVKRPFGVVVASAVVGFRTLLRGHVELAKIEATEAASIRAKGVGMMAAAGVLGVFALAFVGATVVTALALVMPAWAADLIMAALFIAAAGVSVLVGRHALRTAPKPMTKTQETLKEDARWARRQIAR
jgi:uncharacterized membrane protein YqjE